MQYFNSSKLELENRLIFGLFSILVPQVQNVSSLKCRNCELNKMGACTNHVDRILGNFDPPPPMWTLLLNSCY